MKKWFKYLLVLLIIPVALFTFVGCGETGKSVVSIDKTDSVGNVDTYTITYTDGTTSNFVIANGKDGEEIYQNITLDDLYEAVKARKGLGDEYTIVDFIYEYLDVSFSASEIASSTALRSAVTVFTEHQIQIVDYNNVTGYTSDMFSGMQTNYGVKTSISWGAGAGVIYSLDKERGDAYIITNYHVCFATDTLATDGIGEKFTCFIYGSETISYEDLYYLSYYNENCKTYAKCYDYDEAGLPIIDYGYGAISASYVGGSVDYDIAVLKIENSDILKQSDAQAVEVANSNTVTAGATAIAVGNPDACGLSVTSGVVSVDSEYINVKIGDTTSSLREFRIDTPVNSGNSGGGLFDSKGRLIGIVNAKTSSTTTENMSYAIPSNIAIGMAKSIIDNCDGAVTRKTSKVQIGITVQNTNSKAVYDDTTGLYTVKADVAIQSIVAEGVADDMGLKSGDILKSITIIRGDEKKELYGDLQENGVAITRLYTVVDFLLNARVGDIIQIEYSRGGVIGTAVSVALTQENFVTVQ